MWKTTKEQPKRLLFENIFGNIANLEYFPPQVIVAQLLFNNYRREAVKRS